MKILVGLFVVSLSTLALAKAPDNKAKYLTLEKIKVVELGKGSSAEAVVEAVVEKGYHVQSNPAAAPNLIPTTLKVDPKPGTQLGQPLYPAGKEHRVQGVPDPITTYDSKFQIKLPVTALADAKTGVVNLEGSLRYQACSEKTCFFPMTVPVSIPVKIK